MSDRTIRFAGVAGIVFVVLILITVFSTGSPPMADDPVDKIRAFLVDHRSALLISNVIAFAAIPFVLWFAVVLRELVRGDRTANALGTLSLAGLLVTGPMAMAGGAIQEAPLYVKGVADKLSDDTLRVVFETQLLLFSATSAGIIAFALGAAFAIRRTGALPTYVMWLGFVAAIGNAVALLSALSSGAAGIGILGLLTFAVFILVAGIAMAAGKATPAATS